MVAQWKTKESRYAPGGSTLSSASQNKDQPDPQLKVTDSIGKPTQLGVDTPSLSSTKSEDPSTKKGQANQDPSLTKSSSVSSPSKAQAPLTTDGQNSTKKSFLKTQLEKEAASEDKAEPEPQNVKRKSKATDDDAAEDESVPDTETRKRGEQLVVPAVVAPVLPVPKKDDDLFSDLLKNRAAPKKVVAPPKEVIIPGDFLSKVNSKIYSCISELQTEQLKGKSTRVESVLQTLQQLREQLFEQQSICSKRGSEQPPAN